MPVNVIFAEGVVVVAREKVVSRFLTPPARVKEDDICLRWCNEERRSQKSQDRYELAKSVPSAS
jgi:hypothetical protein